MCDDIEALIVEMKAHKIACAPVQNMGWGLLTRLTLPGGGKLGIYQPRHARPKAARARTARKAARPARTPRKKTPTKRPGRR
jgi:hypothetical protein